MFIGEEETGRMLLSLDVLQGKLLFYRFSWLQVDSCHFVLFEADWGHTLS